jgi:hypothetical protein
MSNRSWVGEPAKPIPVILDRILILDSTDSDNNKLVTLGSIPEQEFFGPWTADHDAGGFNLSDLNAILDTNGLEQLIFANVASAVNEITITNAATANNPVISASGTDTDIDFEIVGKGTGNVVFVADGARSGFNVGARSGPDPTTSISGDLYFNSTTNTFRGFDGTTWDDLLGEVFTWSANHDAAGFNLLNVGFLQSDAAIPANSGELRLGNTERVAWRNAANTDDVTLRVNNSDVFVFEINSASEFRMNATELDILGNNLIDFGFLESNDASPASAGAIRLGNTEEVAWRNAGNTDNHSIRATASDELFFQINGVDRYSFDDTRVNFNGINTASILELEASHITPIIGDDVGQIDFIDDNDGGTLITYGEILTEIADPLDLSEEGTVSIRVQEGGLLTTYMSLNPTATNTVQMFKELDMNTNSIQLEEITTPTTPAANNGRLYVKDSDTISDLFFLDDTGNEKNFIPNPTRQINAISESQLVAALGSNLEIPDGESILINVQDSFTITTGFKIGDGSRLKIQAVISSTNLTFSGSGPLISNLVPSEIAGSTILNAVNFIATGGGTLFDLDFTGIFEVSKCTFADFASLGVVRGNAFGGFLALANLLFTNSDIGLVLESGANLILQSVNIVQISPAPDAFVALTLLSGLTSADIFDLNDPIATTPDSLLFIDPNSSASNSYGISNCEIGAAGDFYQQGVDIAIDSVADNGSTETRYTTAAVHDLAVGQPVVINGFVTQTTYNGTAIVTAIPTTTTFDTATTFVATDTGNMNEQSLESDAIIVNAFNNAGRRDSLAAGEADSTTDILVDIITQNVFEPIEKAVPVAGDFDEDASTERFTVDTSTGVITYVGLEPLTCVISFQARAIKVSGGDPDVTVSLFKNSTQETKTDITVTAPTAPGGVALYTGGLFSVVTSDTFQLFLSNTTNATDITISDLTVTVREA